MTPPTLFAIPVSNNAPPHDEHRDKEDDVSVDKASKGLFDIQNAGDH
ncbi:hypothetical protein CW298_0143 [Salmonella enterica subsp. enterica serovar Muenchen]|nr:hypothetical protein CW298_0143 [Salmonella enterica subsp. enterica serovar Muenchen]